MRSGAIHAGKVRCNGSEVKASRQASIGDRYEIKTETRKWIIGSNVPCSTTASNIPKPLIITPTLPRRMKRCESKNHRLWNIPANAKAARAGPPRKTGGN